MERDYFYSTEHILVDSSVWVDHLKGKVITPQVQYLRKIIHTHKIYTLPVIVQEVLQGVDTDKKFEEVRKAFLGFELIEFSNQYKAAVEIATYYRLLRTKGVTAGSNDCIIAYACITFGLRLLHTDNDFKYMARGVPELKLVDIDE